MTKSIIEQIEDVIAPALASQWKDDFQQGQRKIAAAIGEILDTLPKDEPLEPDPRFPKRPTHPDFARLSSAVAAQDAEADMLGVNQAASVHLPSFAYLAQQRVSMALTHLPVGHELAVAVLSLYLDAFQLGVGFTNRGGHRDLPAETGTAGEGSSS